MTNLVQSLFRIDPTEGLVQYANAVKPYHSKVLDVLVEYIYKESVNVSMKERWSWKMTFERPKVDRVYTCGYGLVWDPYRSAEAAPSVNVVSAQSTISLPLTILSTTDHTIVSIPQSGYTLTDGIRVTLHSTGTLPTSTPQVEVGRIYTVRGHNASFQLIDPTTDSPVIFSAVGVGECSIQPFDLKFNSFLVQPNYGSDHTVAVINTKANQLAFSNVYAISGVNPAEKTWTISTDIRPLTDIQEIKYDNPAALPSPNKVGNCNMVFSGNVEDRFPAGSSFTIISGPNAGTYNVADAGSERQLTRFDGHNTIVPIDQLVPDVHAGGTAQSGFDTILPIGSNIYINNNTGIGGNGRYTVVGVTVQAGATIVTVSETVSMLAAGNGNANIIVQPSQVPAWPTGLLVSFTSTGALPPPLTDGIKLYYIPTTKPGVFNLSTKRYPTEYDDYVDITSMNSGVIKMKRAEVFNPGAYVKVSGSYLSKNDGSYIIRKTEQEGANVRVYVMEKIPFTTPQNRAFDGLMEFNFDSYDAPVYCPISQAGDMHADTFIHEKIMFEYSIQLTDNVRAKVAEFTASGFGSSPFGNDASTFGVSETHAFYHYPTPGSAGAPTGTILPHGIDVQLFGVGGLDEDLRSVTQNYGKVV